MRLDAAGSIGVRVAVSYPCPRGWLRTQQGCGLGPARDLLSSWPGPSPGSGRVSQASRRGWVSVTLCIPRLPASTATTVPGPKPSRISAAELRNTGPSFPPCEQVRTVGWRSCQSADQPGHADSNRDSNVTTHRAAMATTTPVMPEPSLPTGALVRTLGVNGECGRIRAGSMSSEVSLPGGLLA
jgi:hypothetical protein